eukprot:gene19894-21837_t
MAAVKTSICVEWKTLGLHRWLVRQCNEMGIKNPTEVQEKTIPEILKGSDCIACAKTGSGKTAAFALPILQKLSENPFGIFALVLTPTRELAFQISEQFDALGKAMNLKTVVVVGGIDCMKQSLALSKIPHIVIATPGRLADLLRSTDTFTLQRIKFLVLDEADRLLEDSFSSDLSDIFDKIPEERQTLLFTATLSEAINQLKETTKKTPFFYEAKSETATVSELDQRYMLCAAQVKDCMLVYILREHAQDKSIIIFTSTCRKCQVLAYLLRKVELNCVSLHSLLSQSNRLSTLARFRSGIVKILVCTDVASRGLDIPQVDLVINSNVPAQPTDYIHRVGRTARAGRGGMAITLMTQYDIERIQAIEERINTKLTEFDVNETEALKLLKAVSVVKREVELRLDDSKFGEKREINKRKKRMLDKEERKSSTKKKKKQHIT